MITGCFELYRGSTIVPNFCPLSNLSIERSFFMNSIFCVGATTIELEFTAKRGFIVSDVTIYEANSKVVTGSREIRQR